MNKMTAWICAALLSVCALCPHVAAESSFGDNDVPDDWDRKYTLGDVNNDGSIDGLDLLALRMRIAGLQDSGNFVEKAADIDKSGSIDSADLIELRRMIAGL